MTLTLPAVSVALVVSLLVAPLAAQAQQPGRLWRLGVLSAGSRATTPGQLADMLRELGYVEGKNLAIEARYADGKVERLPELAAELVRLNVAAILAVSNQEIAAARSATATIPIVMLFGADPVGSGFVASLARPGGNITGTAIHPPEIAGKMLELLKETVPKMRRVSVIVNPAYPGIRLYGKEFEGGAQALGLTFQLIEVRQSGDLAAGFEKIGKERPDALYVVADPAVFARLPQIVSFAAQNRLPAIYTGRPFVEAGGLMSYGVDMRDLVRRSLAYVDKVLKGARPADLPIEQPTKFELAINLRTARALGLTIPQSIRLRADYVVE